MSMLLNKLLPGDELPGNDETVNGLRQRAQKNLLQHGLPGLRDERWKYTSLKLLERRDYVDAGDLDQQAVIEQAKTIVGNSPGAGMVVFAGDHCLLVDVPDGVFSLTDSLKDQPADAAPILAADPQVQEHSSDGFIWLNLARSQSGLVLDIPGGEKLDQPLHVVYLSAGQQTSTATHLRHHWKLGRQSVVDIVEHYHNEGAGLINIYRSVELDQDSCLNWVSIQHHGNDFALLQHTHIQQQARAHCRHWHYDLGARLSRQETRVDLAGEQANYEYAGLLLGRQRQHRDQHVLVNHNAKHCNSRQNYRSVLGDHARGVVNTAARVAPGADGSDVEQNTASLLLSHNAEMDAKPELEIHADEVLASHGATIGQLDEDALFYLCSRGIPADQARQMMIGGFVSNTLSDIGNEIIRDQIQALVNRQLEQML